MNTFKDEASELNSSVKSACEQIILLYEKTREKVQKINAKSSEDRPFGRIGFMTIISNPAGPELYFDIILPDDGTTILRFGLGMEKPLTDKTSQFYNLAVQFSVGRSSIDELVAKNEDYSEEDFRNILQKQDTKVIDIALSNNSIYDNTTETSTGKSYRFNVSTTQEEYDENGGIGHDDNYKDTLDAETIALKIKPILDEHFSLI